tara:strand:+ start:132 stop:2048 length:1917 start_codon:yes stop_codon:yes gene_type:complete
MADKTVIIKLDVQEAGAISSIETLNNSLKKLDSTSDEYAVILKKIQVEETKLASIQKQRAGAQKSVTKALDKQSDATGSATAATMELSRVVSDAPYGIRGMANNITQLVSQLGSASKKAGGLGAALKLMGKQLMGPLGIVFLITAAVSALDYFYGAATKAEKSIDSVGESAAKSASALKILVKANDSGTMSMEETTRAVEKANSEYKDLNLQVGENGKITDESVLAINRKISALENLARATALQGLIEEEFVKLIPLEQSLRKEEEEALVKLRVKGINTIKEAQDIADKSKDYALKGYVNGVLAQTTNTQNQIDGIQTNIDKLIETIPNVDDLFGQNKPKGGRKGRKEKRDRVSGLDLESVDIGANKKKMRKVLDAVADAMNIDLKEDPLKINPNFDLTLSDEAKENIKLYLKDVADNLVLDSKLDDFKNFADMSNKILSSMTDFANGEFDREITIEQNKTNALNTELNNRLNNENLSKEQRRSIQNEIAKNDEKLRVKQEVIERKRFKMNKAANIANALMDTASAAAGVMAQAKGGFFSRLAQAIPTIAFGLAQVATIARQKFQSSASKTPISTTSGGGAGSARAEPSFNIVGRSNDNILLSAIQSQFDQPLKAYVVARDVTNQQQLDGIISTAAST